MTDKDSVALELRQQLDKIKSELIHLGDIAPVAPDRQKINQQAIALQKEGIRLADIYRWLMDDKNLNSN